MILYVRRQTADGRRSFQLSAFSSQPADDFSSGLPSAVCRLTSVLLLTAISMLSLAGCNEPFEPFQENEQYYFSIYGYLDASADTQWVRVSPARQEFNMPPTVPDVRVTLENLQNGNRVVMNDSLVVPGSGFNYLNFWSTMEIEHGQAYRVSAERPDGATSRVTVTLPEMFPTPRLKENERFASTAPLTYTLIIEDVEKLADVQTRWYVGLFGPNLDTRRVYSFSHRNEAERISDGSFTVFLEPEKEREEIEKKILLPPGGQIRVFDRQIYVASAGPDWNAEIASFDDPTYAIPNSFSNVEGGLGYVIGIDSKLIPYNSCFDEEGLAPCPEEDPLWYD